MNATKWASLSEFAKYLGRQGICRVEEDEKNAERGGASGLTISWVDNSPEALRRQEALRKKERQDRGDESLEQRMIEEQIRRAKRDGAPTAEEDNVSEEEDAAATGEGIKRVNGEKVVLNFGAKKVDDVGKPPSPPLTDKDDSEKELATESRTPTGTGEQNTDANLTKQHDDQSSEAKTEATGAPTFKTMSLSSSKPKNVFAAASKKNVLGGPKKPSAQLSQKPMSEAERIMKEEIERKRQREMNGGNAFKRQRVT